MLPLLFIFPSIFFIALTPQWWNFFGTFLGNLFSVVQNWTAESFAADEESTAPISFFGFGGWVVLEDEFLDGFYLPSLGTSERGEGASA